MACCPKSIIEDVLKKHDKITHVYFVACGGSYAGLYPAKYFLQSEAKDLIIGHYSSNEFCHATPKALGKDSIVITQSFSGTTPETVRAAGIAQEAGAASIAVTYDAESPLAKNGDHVVTYGTTKEANDNGHAKALWLAVEILNQIEGYAHYDAFMASYEKYNEIVPAAKEKFAPTAKAWAEKYGEEKLIYVMGSGPNFGVTYSYAICLLQEMQWIHSSAIHSGEYFHGPFEITDKDVPFIMMMSTGRTRALDQRALDFLHPRTGRHDWRFHFHFHPADSNRRHLPGHYGFSDSGRFFLIHIVRGQQRSGGGSHRRKRLLRPAASRRTLQNGLKTYADMNVRGHDAKANSWTLANEGGEKIVVPDRTLRELISEKQVERAKGFSENTPAVDKMLVAQYEDFFRQRDNTANNFRHNLSVYCRKEANSPIDALKVAKAIINDMPVEERRRTKDLLKALRKDGETVNEVVVRTYLDAVKETPLNEEHLKANRYEKMIARPMYDTVSANGAKVDDNFDLKIGDTVNGIAFKTGKTFGIGKDRILQNCKIISASKENNMVTLMDSDKSFYDVPRDTFLKEYARSEKAEKKQERKESRKKSVMRIDIER